MGNANFGLTFFLRPLYVQRVVFLDDRFGFVEQGSCRIDGEKGRSCVALVFAEPGDNWVQEILVGLRGYLGEDTHIIVIEAGIKKLSSNAIRFLGLTKECDKCVIHNKPPVNNGVAIDVPRPWENNRVESAVLPAVSNPN
jgi:hypothetical protein